MATHTTAVLAVVRAARPQFRNRADAVVFALHAALLAEGFVLVAVGDAAEEEPPRGAALAETGHDGWNAARDEYAFRYRREGAGAADGTVVLKALAAGAKLLVDAAPPSPGAVEHLELSVNDFTTDGVAISSAGEAYVNLEGLLARFRAALLPALKPKAASAAGDVGVASSASRERPVREQDSAPPYSGGYGTWGGARAPPSGLYGVGNEDLYPPGMPRLPPLGPMAPPFGGQGGGMLVGPGHPAFFPGGGAPGHAPQLPPGVPPGARFDPFGPPGVPGFEPDRFGGEPGRGGPPIPGQPRPVHPDVMQLGADDIRDVQPFG